MTTMTDLPTVVWNSLSDVVDSLHGDVAVTPNRWDGFDLRLNREESLIRLAQDDTTWNLHLMTWNEVGISTITFQGSLATPTVIAAVITEIIAQEMN